MTSILSGLDIAQQALSAQQLGLSVTQKNVAKANDPNYTRQEIIYSGDPNEWAKSGVRGMAIRATRDSYVDSSICQELQSLGGQNVAAEALKQIDAIFNGSGEDLQQALSDFFNSFASLSSTPEDLTLRQKVLSSANALSACIRQKYDSIQKVQTSADRELGSVVDDVNSITAQIADLNQRIQSGGGASAESQFELIDSRQQLLEKLSGLVDVSYYETESGSITVTTRQGGLLISGNKSQELKAATSAGNAFQRVFLDGADVTDSIESGELGGLVDVRDNKTAAYLGALDDLAATIISRVNEQHGLGSDLNGEDGQDFFASTGTARTMTVALTDPRKIAAAASGGEIGDSTNAKLLASISDEKLFSSAGATTGQFYSNLIYRIGMDEQTAEDNVSGQNDILTHLKNQRDSLSGVNLDEEAVNLIKYQKAYQACARYANVIDTLSDDLLQYLGA
jgi:flagellar hook-associated protein 1